MSHFNLYFFVYKWCQTFFSIPFLALSVFSLWFFIIYRLYHSPGFLLWLSFLIRKNSVYIKDCNILLFILNTFSPYVLICFRNCFFTGFKYLYIKIYEFFLSYFFQCSCLGRLFHTWIIKIFCYIFSWIFYGFSFLYLIFNISNIYFVMYFFDSFHVLTS